MELKVLEKNLEKFPSKGEYLKNQNLKCCENQFKFIENKIPMKFLALYRIDEITYDDESPRKEALENAISSMRIKGINFVYIIKGDKKGVKFYYGVAKDYSVEEDGTPLEVCDIGEKILQPSLQGNFRGSVVTQIESEEREEIVSSLDQFNRIKILEGVPGVNKDDEKFQSVDRLIDVMLGDEFAIMLIAKPMQDNDIFELQKKIFGLYNILAPYSKASLQATFNENKGKSKSVTKGSSYSDSESVSKQKSGGESKTNTDSSNGSSSSSSKAKGINQGWSKGITTSKTSGSNDSKTDNEQVSKSSGLNISKECFDKNIETWLKYIEEIILPRLDYGIGKGLFTTSIAILGNNIASLIKMENTLKSIYGSEVGNKMPLNAFEVNQIEKALLKNFQIPILYSNVNDFEKNICMAVSQFYVDTNRVLLGNWMSSKEISLLASLPKKEVVGLELKEEVEFGLNIKNDDKNDIPLGYLVQSGQVLNGENGLPNIPIKFNKEYYDKHIFVTGVTGGGKTTTCQKLLLSSESNFLVIEPAKTEYRVMCEKEFPDMLVFTLGNESGAPFRLNPFEFFEGESITSRVDMIKASMEAAFDMEAAIPQLLEAAIYECYEDKGWNISTNKNYNCDNPFASGKYYFPTLGDLNLKIEKVVKDQKFDERLKDEYIGSIRARLKGLIVGSKGQMLNTKRSIDFVQLLDKKVVLELENIKNTSEKSLIMGFILSNLYEAIKVKYKKNGMKKIRHLTLIEEAHRLLSSFTPGDSLNKKQSVEMFTDLLAEVRKYGESLIISDQIPNKLTSEVLKNTNTKIVHKIFAQDDKEAIGNTMALNDEQKKYLSYLTTGRAIMTMPNLDKAIQVQIERTDQNDTERAPLEDEILRKRIIKYFSREYKKGILPGLEILDNEPSEKLVEIYFKEFAGNSKIVKVMEDIFKCKENYEELKIELEKYSKVCELKYILLFLILNMEGISITNITNEIIGEIEGILKKIMEGKVTNKDFNYLENIIKGGK